jgi:hypothetical protein
MLIDITAIIDRQYVYHLFRMFDWYWGTTEIRVKMGHMLDITSNRDPFVVLDRDFSFEWLWNVL